MISAAPKRRRLGDPEAQSMANVHKWGLLYGPRFPKSCLHEFYQVLMAVCEYWKFRVFERMRLLSTQSNTSG